AGEGDRILGQFQHRGEIMAGKAAWLPEQIEAERPGHFNVGAVFQAGWRRQAEASGDEIDPGERGHDHLDEEARGTLQEIDFPCRSKAHVEIEHAADLQAAQYPGDGVVDIVALEGMVYLALQAMGDEVLYHAFLAVDAGADIFALDKLLGEDRLVKNPL